jgi:FecR protein
MQFMCTCAVAVLVSGLMFALPSQYAFAGEGWRIIDTAGDVKAGGAGFMPIALSRSQTLPADAWVETSATGRAVLARGLESIVVGPNSRVQLPNDEVNGNTQILQTMGSALYQIGKQQRPHFQVDTPYLAAVVKGTTFTVTVQGDTATVAVSEGLVEVSTPDHSDIEFVQPGFTASVSQDHRGEVMVEKSDEGSAQSRSLEPLKDNNSASDELAKSDENAGDIVITAPVGEVELDVKEVSSGLAFGDAVSTAHSESSNDIGASKDNTDTDNYNVETTDSVLVAGISEDSDPASGTGSTSPDLSLGRSDLGIPVDGGGSALGSEPDLGSGVPTLDDGGNSFAYGHTKEKIKKTK